MTTVWIYVDTSKEVGALNAKAAVLGAIGVLLSTLAGIIASL